MMSLNNSGQLVKRMSSVFSGHTRRTSIRSEKQMSIERLISVIEQFYESHQTSFFVATSVVVTAWLFNRFYINRSSYQCQQSMRNKTVLITGANTGIGYETAKDLLRRGARVILACRNTKKGNEAMRQLLLETNSSTDNLRLMECDLSSFNSVRSFAKFFNETENQLDVLICNAAVSSASPTISKDGFNTVIQTNYLGHFLLTNLLLNKLKSSRSSRILNVSSKLHQSQRSIDWDDAFRQERAPRWYGAYPMSKLFQILSTIQLRKILGDEIRVFSLTPGWVATSLSDPSVQSVGWIPFLLSFPLTRMIKFIFAKSPKKGAETVIFCAVEPSLETTDHFYFQNCSPANPSSLAMDPLAAEKLWTLSLEAVGLSSSIE